MSNSGGRGAAPVLDPGWSGAVCGSAAVACGGGPGTLCGAGCASIRAPGSGAGATLAGFSDDLKYRTATIVAATRAAAGMAMMRTANGIMGGALPCKPLAQRQETRQR